MPSQRARREHWEAKLKETLCQTLSGSGREWRFVLSQKWTPPNHSALITAETKADAKSCTQVDANTGCPIKGSLQHLLQQSANVNFPHCSDVYFLELVKIRIANTDFVQHLSNPWFVAYLVSQTTRQKLRVIEPSSSLWNINWQYKDSIEKNRTKQNLQWDVRCLQLSTKVRTVSTHKYVRKRGSNAYISYHRSTNYGKWYLKMQSWNIYSMSTDRCKERASTKKGQSMK